MRNQIRETLAGGAHRSIILRRGSTLRVTDSFGGANVGMMMLSASERSERLNIPDSLKCQHTARLHVGHCLYSDMGRILVAIVGGSCDWHDVLCGLSDASEVATKYGAGTYGDLRNAFHRNGTDNMLVEMGKWGLGAPDLLMSVNLFSRVEVRENGHLQFVDNGTVAGDYIDLYAMMDTLIFLTAIQHPLDPYPAYAPKPVEIEIQLGPDDGTGASTGDAIEHCRLLCEENVRGFANTAWFLEDGRTI